MNQYSGRQARPQASINSLKWLWLACQALFLLSSLFTTLPSYADTRISVGDHHACVIRADDTVLCWGNSNSPEETLYPEGKFTQVSVNKLGKGSCGLRTDNTISCWGGEIANIPVPSGKFIQVNFDQHLVDYRSDPYSACAIRLENNKIICWDTSGNLFEPSQESFVKIGLNSDAHFGCGILTDKSISCWGLSDILSESQPPAGKFSQVLFKPVSLVTGSYYIICGLAIEGNFMCTAGRPSVKGNPVSDSSIEIIHQEDYLNRVFRVEADKSFHAISAYSAYYHGVRICGLRKDAAIDRLMTCWGTYSDISPVAGFTEISVGLNYGCGIKSDNSILCWGSNASSYINPANILPNKPPTAILPKIYPSVEEIREDKEIFAVDNVLKLSIPWSNDGSLGDSLLFVPQISKDEGGSISSSSWSITDESGNPVKMNEYYIYSGGSDSVFSVPFYKSGTYTEKLVVKDNEGYQSEASRVIKVLSRPTANFYVEDESQPSSNQPYVPTFYLKKLSSVKFDASKSQSESENTITDYMWKISKRNSVDSTETMLNLDIGNIDNPSINFSDYGVYVVTLQVKDSSGELSIPAKLEIRIDNESPKVSFTVDRSEGSSPLIVEVDASQSTDVDGISEYIWKITNINTGVEPVSPKLGNQAKGELIFTEPSSYAIYLTVIDKFGMSMSTPTFTRIEVSNSPPTATMKILSNIKGKIPLSVKLDASDSVDSDGKIQNYSWHIREDDSIVIDNAKIPKPFTLSKAGTYTVVLTVTDDRWATASTEQTIIAQAEDNRLPVAKIKAQTSTQGVAPLTVRFDGSSSSDVDGQLTDYEWMVSDGRESVKGNDAFPSLLFNRVGDYTITLKVTDNSGGSSTDTMKVTVTDGCVATYSPESGNGRVQIPCVAVEGQPLSGYEVILWQHNLANAFLFDLNLSSSTYLKTKKLPDESKCKAIYNSQSGELHIPCVQYGEKSFDVYLLLRLNMSSDFFMTFGLDDNRVKINP